LIPRRLCDDDRAEFIMITVWDGLESIIVSAGPYPDPGRVLPLDAQRPGVDLHVNWRG
jgi:hypothetical protein